MATQTRLSAMRKAVTAARDCYVAVFSSDDAHYVRISKTAAYELLKEAPEGWTVATSADGTAAELIAAGKYDDEAVCVTHGSWLDA